MKGEEKVEVVGEKPWAGRRGWHRGGGGGDGGGGGLRPFWFSGLRHQSSKYPAAATLILLIY